MVVAFRAVDGALAAEQTTPRDSLPPIMIIANLLMVFSPTKQDKWASSWTTGTGGGGAASPAHFRNRAHQESAGKKPGMPVSVELVRRGLTSGGPQGCGR